MGSGIAQVLSVAGAQVRVVDVDLPHAQRAVARLCEQAFEYESRGLLSPGAADQVAERTRPAESLAQGAAEADLFVEAVPENLDLKRQVLSLAENAAPAAAILTSNTSSIPIATLASSLHEPQRLIGLHWFNPPQFVPGVEIIPGPGTPDAVVVRLRALLTAAGKAPAVVRDSPGFVANRLQFALFREAVQMLEEGLASAEDIDTVVTESFGYRLPFFGPFAIADMAGLDVYASAIETLAQAYGERFTVPPQLAELVGQGRLGVKSGGGFLRLTEDEAAAMLARRDRLYVRLRQLLADG
jgi:3-hydroxybutyryl-CoA dehydrogenase